MKKNKIFIFVILLFSFVVFWANYSFADNVLLTFDFKGFDDVEYSLPILPSSIEKCNNYAIFLLGNGKIFLVGCNGNLDIKWNGANDVDVISADGSDLTLFYLNSINDVEWNRDSVVHPKKFGSSVGATMINCSDDLYVYKEKFNSHEDFFLTPLPVVLAPIVETVRLEGVLQEIVEILPVVLVIIVGLIGLRKALKMLSTVLHRS